MKTETWEIVPPILYQKLFIVFLQCLPCFHHCCISHTNQKAGQVMSIKMLEVILKIWTAKRAAVESPSTEISLKIIFWLQYLSLSKKIDQTPKACFVNTVFVTSRSIRFINFLSSESRVFHDSISNVDEIPGVASLIDTNTILRRWCSSGSNKIQLKSLMLRICANRSLYV